MSVSKLPALIQLIDKVDTLTTVQDVTTRKIDAIAAELAELMKQFSAISLSNIQLTEREKRVTEREAALDAPRVTLSRQQAEDAGHVMSVGPRGGIYYMSKSNNKVYVKR